MLKVETLKREFVYDGKTLTDPNPNLTPYQVVEFYSNEYPEFASAAIQKAKEQKEGLMTYEIKSKIGTNG